MCRLGIVTVEPKRWLVHHGVDHFSDTDVVLSERKRSFGGFFWFDVNFVGSVKDSADAICLHGILSGLRRADDVSFSERRFA